jgi:phosphoglycolate phosphatase
MSYQLIIFDFDGTLADSFPWFRGVWNDVADHFGIRRTAEEEIESLRAFDAQHILRHLGVPLWKLPLIVRHVRSLMAREVDRISLFPGASALLQELADGGIQMAIVSSNSLPNVRAILGAQNAALIRQYECAASIFGKRSKLRRVLRASGLQCGEVICVGDELRDLEAAHAEGMAFGAATWGYTSAEALARHAPQFVFARIEEIGAKVRSDSST